LLGVHAISSSFLTLHPLHRECVEHMIDWRRPLLKHIHCRHPPAMTQHTEELSNAIYSWKISSLLCHVFGSFAGWWTELLMVLTHRKMTNQTISVEEAIFVQSYKSGARDLDLEHTLDVRSLRYHYVQVWSQFLGYVLAHHFLAQLHEQKSLNPL